MRDHGGFKHQDIILGGTDGDRVTEGVVWSRHGDGRRYYLLNYHIDMAEIGS